MTPSQSPSSRRSPRITAWLAAGALVVGSALALLVAAPPQDVHADPAAPTSSSRPAKSAEIYTAWPFDAREAAQRRDATAAALGIPKDLSVDLGAKVALKFLLIPAGKFHMGSPKDQKDHMDTESPDHDVTITRPFYMAQFKVTQAQYQQVMGKNPAKFVGENFPVDSVTYDLAAEFCKKAAEKTSRKIHLPTEAQWEYACRAGTSTRYNFGDDETRLPEYCWFHDNNAGAGSGHPVGQKKPNAWGLFDMHGMLWEWCSDFWAPNYNDAKDTDPTGPAEAKTHTARGATWGSRTYMLRSAVRMTPTGEASPELWNRFGFRVMLDVQ